MAVANLNPGDLYFDNFFNDATRKLEGGLWTTTVEEGAQGFGSSFRYIADLNIVKAGLTADVAAGDFSGDQLTHINTVLADLTIALTNVQGAVNNVAADEQALRTAHLDIINTIENDPLLQGLSIKDGNAGFNFAPPASATPINNHTPHATFAEIGAIYDDVQSRFLGGLNATPDGAAHIQKELTIVENSLTKLMHDHPELFGGATGIHAQTIVDQIHLQINNFDHQYGFSPVAARATQDNLLDIDDIVAGDNNLFNMSQLGAVHGWTPAPFTDIVTHRYQDNAAQTNFWADFIASGNVLGNKAIELSQTGTHAQIQAFEKVLVGWEANVGNFDKAQGGIFEARFDNELISGPNSTIAADVAAMIKGLNTHNATLVTNAAEGFFANAADVSGNNIPVNGGTFNPNGLTIAEALNQTVAPPPSATLLTPASPPANSGHDDRHHHNNHSDLLALLAPSHDTGPQEHEHQHFHFHWDLG